MPALFALAVWSVQRVVTKVALVRWSTARFYRWNALLSLPVYAVFALFEPPRADALAAALGMSLYMALAFWVATEATRRGPLGIVAPLTAASPAITVVLAMALLGERPDAAALAGVIGALAAAALLAFRPVAVAAIGGWLAFAIGSLLFQGLGAFLAKVVVTEGNPSTLLLTSAAVQVAVGLWLARGQPLRLREHARGAPLLVTLILVAAAVATIGYLSALSVGPASVVVPLVATSPSLGGLLGIVLLRERATRRQLAAIVVGVIAIVLLAAPR